MKTEQEINDAIAIVQEAAEDGRLEYQDTGYGWLKTDPVTIVPKYRAKPDPIERWFVYYIEYGEMCEYIFPSEDAAREFAESRNYICRIAYLREVE